MMRALAAALVLAACHRPAPPASAPAVDPIEAAADAGVARASCAHAGATYADGETIPIGDDCNTCVCADGHKTQCTRTICDVQIIERVEFVAGSTVVPADEAPLLDAVAAVLAAHPEIKIALVGHASFGEADAQALSEQRALAVHAELLARGVAADQLATTEGRGTAEPLGGDPARDRRVDFAPLGQGS